MKGGIDATVTHSYATPKLEPTDENWRFFQDTYNAIPSLQLKSKSLQPAR